MILGLFNWELPAFGDAKDEEPVALFVDTVADTLGKFVTGGTKDIVEASPVKVGIPEVIRLVVRELKKEWVSGVDDGIREAEVVGLVLEENGMGLFKVPEVESSALVLLAGLAEAEVMLIWVLREGMEADGEQVRLGAVVEELVNVCLELLAQEDECDLIQPV